MKTVIAASIAALIAIAHPAAAQPTFGEIRTSGLPTVFVTERSGAEVRGTLLQITDSTLTIRIDGATRTFTPADVLLVERKGDSLKNGAIIGMSVGVVLGTLSMAIADCPAGTHSCPGSRIAGVLLGTGVYTAIGVGLDAAVQGRTRIWPTRQSKAGLIATAAPQTRAVFVGWRITR